MLIIVDDVIDLSNDLRQAFIKYTKEGLLFLQE